MSDKPNKLGPAAKEPYSKVGKDRRAEINKENASKNKKVLQNIVYPKKTARVGKPLKSNDYDMLADIYDARAKYNPEKKIQAAVGYMLTGTLTGAARLSGIPKTTIWDWKHNSQWWDNVLANVRKEKQDELDAMMTDTIHKGMGQLVDRLENGDEVVVKKGDDYEKVRRKMSGRDIATSVNTLYHNRAALRGDPTSISAKASTGDVLKKLKESFEEIAKEAAKTELNKTVVN